MIVLTKEEAQIADSLRRLIDSKGMSVRELARVSGVPHPTVQKVVAGNRSPRIGIVVKLARALEVTVDDLLASPDTTKPKRRVAS